MANSIDLGKITASVTVGTVTTGEAGSSASVTNSGTTQDAILNFTIPRGAKGDTGNTGPTGPTGPQGPMGPSGYSGAAEDLEVVQVSGNSATAVMSQKAVTDKIDEVKNVYNLVNTDADLDIGDEDGNVIVKFRGGHLQTQKFDSRNLSVYELDDFDFSVSDVSGNVILALSGGDLKTRNFNSKNIPYNVFKDAYSPDYEYRDAITRQTFESNPYLRIPFCEYTNTGRLIVGCDVRYGSSSDQTKISVGIVISDDNGQTFEPQIIIPHTEQSSWDRAMDATILVDRSNNNIFVIAHRITTTNIWEQKHTVGDYGFDCVMVKSTDNGDTWTEPVSMKGLMVGGSYGSDVVTMFGGVGHGITMNDGTLVFPIQCKMASNNTSATGTMFNIQSGIIYSRDGGLTWTRSNLIPCYSSENMVVEYEQGKLMMNARSYIGKRRIFTTEDLGENWEASEADKTIIEPVACQGSFQKAQLGWKSKGLFLNPMNSLSRQNMVVYETFNYVGYKPILRLIKGNTSGYSCLCCNQRHTVAVYETEGCDEIRMCDISNVIW